MNRGDQDVQPDPHLEAALRHAPDADISAPPLLRARIVAAARRSADDAKRSQPWWKRLDEWLTPARLGGAGTAAAAVLAATVLWVGRDEQPAAPDLRPALPGKESAAANRTAVPAANGAAVTGASTPGGSADFATAAPPPPTGQAPGTPTAATEAQRDALRAAARNSDDRSALRLRQAPGATREQGSGGAGPTAPSGARAIELDAAGPAEARASAERGVAEARARAEAAATQRQERSARVEEPQRRAAAAAAPVAAAAPAAPAAPPPAQMADAPRAAVVTSPTPFPSSAGAGVAGVPAPAPAPSPARPAPPLAQSPPAPAATDPATSGSGASAATPTSPSMGAVERAAPSEAARLRGDTRIGALSASVGPLIDSWRSPDPSGWRRLNPGGDDAPLPATWLTDLAAATQGRWTAADSRTIKIDETWSTLVHTSGLRARLLLANGIVTLCDAGGARCERAGLEEAAQQSLQRALRR